MMKLKCSNCQKALVAKDEMGGKRVRCPACGHHLTVPEVSRPTHVGATQNENSMLSRQSQVPPDLSRIETASTQESKRMAYWKFPYGGVFLLLGILVVWGCFHISTAFFSGHTEATTGVSVVAWLYSLGMAAAAFFLVRGEIDQKKGVRLLVVIYVLLFTGLIGGVLILYGWQRIFEGMGYENIFALGRRP